MASLEVKATMSLGVGAAIGIGRSLAFDADTDPDADRAGIGPFMMPSTRGRIESFQPGTLMDAC
jgi:hypothetical protein